MSSNPEASANNQPAYQQSELLESSRLDTAIDFCRDLGQNALRGLATSRVVRGALALGLAAGAGTAVGVTSEMADPRPEVAVANGGYPDWNAPCVANNNNVTTGTCTNYDWGYYLRNAEGDITGRYTNSTRGYGYRNCTDWVAWRAQNAGVGTVPGGWSHAKNWDDTNKAGAAGFAVDTTPEPGDIAVWNAGTYGHVAFVEEIGTGTNAGKVRVSEYNKGEDGTYRDDRWVTADSYIDLNGADKGINGEDLPGDGGGSTPPPIVHYADYGIYRYDPATSTGYWYAKSSSTGGSTPIWGTPHGGSGDVPVVGDFDGDNYDDYGIYRNGTWYVKSGTTGQQTAIWGATHGSPGDIPVVGDVNGDGYADFGIYRLVNGAGTWYFKSGSNGQNTPIWGAVHGSAGDIPVVGDFNGDDIDDFGIYRMEPDSNGRWYVKSSANGQSTPIWGAAHGSPGDIPIVGDFNGDDIDDFGIYRSINGTGYWYPKSSSDGQQITSAWGVTHGGWAQDKPLAGNFGL